MDSKKWMIIKNIDSYAVVVSVVAGQRIIFCFVLAGSSTLIFDIACVRLPNPSQNCTRYML